MIEMFEKFKESIAPTRETKYRDLTGKVVSCKVMDDEGNRFAGVCRSEGKAFEVEDVRNTSEISAKSDLTPPIEREISRDYSRIRVGAKIGVIGLGALCPPLAEIKPFTDIFL